MNNHGNQTAVNARNAMNAYVAFEITHRYAKVMHDAKQELANHLAGDPLGMAVKIAFAELHRKWHRADGKQATVMCDAARVMERYWKEQPSIELLEELKRAKSELGFV